MTMENTNGEKICPQCGAAKMKNWLDLTDEQKFLLERLPLSAEYAPRQRKKHRFCVQCWFENVEPETQLV